MPSHRRVAGGTRVTARRLWTWLTTCAADGCSRHPAHLGWCAEHVPVDDPGPDEYWPDEYWGDPDGESR